MVHFKCSDIFPANPSLRLISDQPQIHSAAHRQAQTSSLSHKELFSATRKTRSSPTDGLAPTSADLIIMEPVCVFTKRQWDSLNSQKICGMSSKMLKTKPPAKQVCLQIYYFSVASCLLWIFESILILFYLEPKTFFKVFYSWLDAEVTLDCITFTAAVFSLRWTLMRQVQHTPCADSCILHFVISLLFFCAIKYNKNEAL